MLSTQQFIYILSMQQVGCGLIAKTVRLRSAQFAGPLLLGVGVIINKQTRPSRHEAPPLVSRGPAAASRPAPPPPLSLPPPTHLLLRPHLHFPLPPQTTSATSNSNSHQLLHQQLLHHLPPPPPPHHSSTTPSSSPLAARLRPCRFVVLPPPSSFAVAIVMVGTRPLQRGRFRHARHVLPPAG